MNNKIIKIGVIGIGTVGSALINHLKSNKKVIQDISGYRFEVTSVCAKSKLKKRNCNISNIKFFSNPLKLVESPNVDIVVELIGGTKLAFDIFKAANKLHKPLVTANKALIALKGNQIDKILSKKYSPVFYEASVAGGIPIIKVMKESLAGNKIQYIAGIINGTTNYILTEMGLYNKKFNDTLKKAQELGYAESDPTFDVGGIDAAHKLTILASLAFGFPLSFKNVYIEGIEKITPEDHNYASQLGYNIKHLAICKKTQKGVQLRVHPCFVPSTRLIANVNGVMNAIVVSSIPAGKTLYYGPGAGGSATASSVLTDIIDAGKYLNTSNVDKFSITNHININSNLNLVDIADIKSSYYLRLRVINKAGVLAKITKLLGSKSISIESIIQKEEKFPDNTVPLVIETHEVEEKNLLNAIKFIERIKEVKNKVVKIRIEKLS